MKFVAIFFVCIVAAAARLSPMRMECPEDAPGVGTWSKLETRRERTCMLIHSTPMRFREAAMFCHRHNSMLLSLRDNNEKLVEVIRVLSSEPNAYFMNSYGIHRFIQGYRHHRMEDQALLDFSGEKWHVRINNTDVPRPFLCERHGIPASLSPRFSIEPSDAIVVKGSEKEVALKFVCKSFGKVRPDLRWFQIIYNNTHPGEYHTKAIDAKTTIRHEDIHGKLTDLTFMDLRTRCNRGHCSEIFEQSILLVRNAQLLTEDMVIVCGAQNKYGESLSREARIDLTTFGEFKNDKLIEYTVEEGKSLRIPCGEINTETNRMTVRFRKHLENERIVDVAALGTATEKNKRFFVSQARHELIVNGAITTDSGVYSCEARMPNGPEFAVRQRLFKVVVMPCPEERVNHGCKFDNLAIVEGYPVMFSEDFHTNEAAYEGNNVVLECPHIGRGNKIEWEKSEQKLSEELLKRSVLGSSHLFIRHAKAEDAGIYRCRAVMENITSEWKELDLVILPRLNILTRPQNQIVSPGANVTVECKFSGANLIVTPVVGRFSLLSIWNFKYLPMERNRFVIKEYTKDSIVYEVLNFQEVDNNSYGCRATSLTEEKIESDFFYSTKTVLPEL